MSTLIEKLDETVAFIKEKIGKTPTIGVVLGSGLGEFADSLEDKVEISYQDIPGFIKTTVIGHAGKLVIGSINGVQVAVMAGRNHAYEGHDFDDVVYPVRVLGRLGCEKVILTNAAGGINTNRIAQCCPFGQARINALRQPQ